MSSALTPSFLFDFESRMRAITENEYARLSSNLWWSRFMKTRPTEKKKELVAWLWSTAKIEDLDTAGGKIQFEELSSTYQTFEVSNAGAGLRLRRQQLMDLDGDGLDLAAKWSGDIGAYMAYWPQKQLVNLIKANGTGYDGKPYFANNHLVNPANAALASAYSNIHTAGSGAGAVPIDESVALDVALANLGKVIASVRSIKMPNGDDPRFLRPTALIVPPKLQARAMQLTNAKFIAQAASSGGGSGDVEAVISSFGFTVPVVADELAGFESDTTWFLACEELAASSQLGAFVYVDREPFKINYYTGQDGGGLDADLNRRDELEWHCKGRNVTGYGHPFLFHKCKAS
jgi:phage major head subunit gpT-like protein